MDIGQIEDHDFYVVDKENGKTYVELIGYYYRAEDTPEDAYNGKNCRHIEQSIRMSLDRLREVLASEKGVYGSQEAMDRPLDWIEDLTEEEMVARFDRDCMECERLELDEVDEDTPEGTYVTGVFA